MLWAPKTCRHETGLIAKLDNIDGIPSGAFHRLYVEAHSPSRLVGTIDMHVRATNGAFHSRTVVHLADLALILKPVLRYRADTFNHLHCPGIRELDLRSPHGTNHVSPVIVLGLLQRLSWLRLVLVRILDLATIDLGRLLVQLILGGFFLVRTLMIGIVLFRFGIWIFVLGTEDAFVIRRNDRVLVVLAHLADPFVRTPHFTNTVASLVHCHLAIPADSMLFSNLLDVSAHTTCCDLRLGRLWWRRRRFLYLFRYLCLLFSHCLVFTAVFFLLLFTLCLSFLLLGCSSVGLGFEFFSRRLFPFVRCGGAACIWLGSG